jgi:cell division protein FtsB
VKPGKKILLIAAPVITVLVLALLTFGERGFLDVYRLHRLEKSRAAEIEAAHAKIDSLKAEVERLRNDTAYIERVAREKLGMARPNEKVFKFVDGDN